MGASVYFPFSVLLNTENMRLTYFTVYSFPEKREQRIVALEGAQQDKVQLSLSYDWITKCYASSVAFSLFLFSSQLLSIAISEGSTRSQIKRWWRWSLGFSKLPPKRTHGPLEYIKTVAVKIILITTTTTTTTTTTDIAFYKGLCSTKCSFFVLRVVHRTLSKEFI